MKSYAFIQTCCRFEVSHTSPSFLLTHCKMFEKQSDVLMSTVLKDPLFGLTVKAYMKVQQILS